jgi:flavin reductase (DIM6/NTAB) family NADH-FMN oxidoreductase RutF
MSEIFGRLGGPRDLTDEDELDAAGPLSVGLESGRWLRRHVAGSVAALTTSVDGYYRASTVTGYMIASLDPLQALISLEQDSQMEHWIRESRIYALSILTYQQQFLADQFAGLAPLAAARFQGIEHHTEVTGAPVLDRSIGWVDCRVAEERTIGDHTTFIGQVVAAGRGTGFADEPLLYFSGRYARAR